MHKHAAPDGELPRKRRRDALAIFIRRRDEAEALAPVLHRVIGDARDLDLRREGEEIDAVSGGLHVRGERDHRRARGARDRGCGGGFFGKERTEDDLHAVGERRARCGGRTLGRAAGVLRDDDEAIIARLEGRELRGFEHRGSNLLDRFGRAGERQQEADPDGIGVLKMERGDEAALVIARAFAAIGRDGARVDGPGVLLTDDDRPIGPRVRRRGARCEHQQPGPDSEPADHPDLHAITPLNLWRAPYPRPGEA
jgi:hypothetical protein